jgi:hypothetical protein
VARKFGKYEKLSDLCTPPRSERLREGKEKSARGIRYRMATREKSSLKRFFERLLETEKKI